MLVLNVWLTRYTVIQIPWYHLLLSWYQVPYIGLPELPKKERHEFLHGFRLVDGIPGVTHPKGGQLLEKVLQMYSDDTLTHDTVLGSLTPV
jgi:hypothetical protein